MKILLPILLLSFSAELWAQSGELWLIGGGSVLLNKGIGSPSSDGTQDDIKLGDGYRAGFRFAFNSSGRIGHEIQYAFNRTKLADNVGAVLGDAGSAGMGIHQGGYNLLYYFPATQEVSKVRPFVTGGVHFSDFVLPRSAALHGRDVKVGFNLGAGVKVRISPLFALRFDVRQYETGEPNWSDVLVRQRGLLLQTEVSAGFGIYF
jgi:opacity protein-like surface antigen